MIERHAIHPLMTLGTEVLGFMTVATIGRLAFGFERVRELKIQIMNLPREVVAAMALQTAVLFTMAGGAPGAVCGGEIAVLMFPVVRVNVQQADTPFMAEDTLG